MEKLRGQMQVAVDAVVFTVENDVLKILLIERRNQPFQGRFALPGGFVNPDEEFEQAVKRELFEETGVKDIFVKQIGAYGKVSRDPRGRIISIAFLALISHDQNLKAATDAAKVKWAPLNDLPPLAFDHRQIISDYLEVLKFEIQTTNIAREILPEEFTLSNLQSLYENILQRKLDKRNFRKKIRELELVKETGKQFMEGAHRPAKLYEFRDKEYENLKERMHVLLS